MTVTNHADEETLEVHLVTNASLLKPPTLEAAESEEFFIFLSYRNFIYQVDREQL
jgi:hypothetical protein